MWVPEFLLCSGFTTRPRQGKPLDSSRSDLITPAGMIAWTSARAFKTWGSICSSVCLHRTHKHTHTCKYRLLLYSWTRHLFWQRERGGHRRLSSTKLIYVGTKTELIRALYAPQGLPVSLFHQPRQEGNDTRYHNIQYCFIVRPLKNWSYLLWNLSWLTGLEGCRESCFWYSECQPKF